VVRRSREDGETWLELAHDFLTPEVSRWLTDEELARRRAGRNVAQRRPLGGLLEKYAATVGPAHNGAVTHSGGVEWPRDE